MDNDDMRHYVEFICSRIKTAGGAEVNRTDGFPMKGYYIPVDIEIVEKMSRSAEIQITAFDTKVKFIFYMSRHRSPDDLLHQLQRKIDEVVLQIIKDKGMDQDKIWHDHHPLRFLNMKDLK